MEEVIGKETVIKLMEETGLFDVPNSDYYEVEGIPLSYHFVTPSTIEALKTWQARPDDAFIVTYPKAGTTWTQEIMSAIQNEGDLSKLNTSHTMLRVPFIEARLFISTKDIKVPPTHEIADRMKSPRTIKSHLPGQLLPPDIMEKKAKIVYVARNPKDLAVSYFYFHNSASTFRDYPSWEEYLKDFISGNLAWGPWWDHYLYFWNRRNEPNILFLKYEDMKQDLKSVVIKIMTFLGYRFSDDVIDNIVDHCTFVNMRKNSMTNPTALMERVRNLQIKKGTKSIDEVNEENKSKTPFLRKGIIGDWKSHFTVAQNETIDAHIEDKLAGSGLTFEY